MKNNSTQQKLFRLFPSLAVAIYIVLAPSIYAATGYTTTFDDFTGNTSLSGNHGSTETGTVVNWDTNDPENGAVGQTDYVGYVGNVSSTGTDYVGAVGGIQRDQVAPGASTVYVSRPFDISSTNGGNGNFAFNVDFRITSSSTTYPTKDSFSWTVGKGGVAVDSRFFSLDFKPDPNNGNLLTISLTYKNLQDPSSTTVTSSSVALPYDSDFHLSLSVGSNSRLTVLLTDSTAAHTTSTVFSNVDLSGTGFATTDITRVAATWILNPTTAGLDPSSNSRAGSNALVFNNYSAVPEPSSVALMGMAGIGGLMAMAKHRKRLSK